jgi:hypothetical protein
VIWLIEEDLSQCSFLFFCPAFCLLGLGLQSRRVFRWYPHKSLGKGDCLGGSRFVGLWFREFG